MASIDIEVAGRRLMLDPMLDPANARGPVRGTPDERPNPLVDLPVPAGCQVMEMVAADDRLILRLGSGERCNQIIVVDAANGRNLGTVRLMPQ